ncbi:MAG: hypothetical protein HOV79_31920 [Hamadaea sp.]|nr:hypothetical protein [Hamadaea sp.]
MSIAGEVVRVGWFTTLGPHLLIVLGERDMRLDLLVVPPDTADDVAREVMAASSAAGTTPDTIDAVTVRLAQATTPPDGGDQDTADVIADSHDDDGPVGLNGHAHVDPPASKRIQ